LHKVYVQLKTEAKLSYSDACKAHRTARSPPIPNVASQSALPPLSKSTVDRSRAGPFISATPLPRATGVQLDQDGRVVTEQIYFSSLLLRLVIRPPWQKTKARLLTPIEFPLMNSKIAFLN